MSQYPPVPFDVECVNDYTSFGYLKKGATYTVVEVSDRDAFLLAKDGSNTMWNPKRFLLLTLEPVSTPSPATSIPEPTSTHTQPYFDFDTYNGIRRMT